ncbi:MAG TPA: hypothetical protein VKZ81_01400 [Pseudonocardia sp.]|jgi:hypothetical protein|uniref:hypothetical protein n=1 Tax=Pseudonocardia sp. TaxID=60912 RepID=UPI002B4B6C1D|nr:hypothetical protein [Pseudonocardia sp.]HLU54090.1 hypothetical protein [Pseudonocardia sp.]
MSAPALEARLVPYTDPLALPLLAELDREYSPATATRWATCATRRCAARPSSARPTAAWSCCSPTTPRSPGDAFRRYDERTAELKRIWTHSAHRRRGFAQRR